MFCVQSVVRFDVPWANGGVQCICCEHDYLLECSYAMPVVVLVVRGRKILERETKGFSLGRYGYVANYVGIIFVGVTSVVSSWPFHMLEKFD